MKKIILGLSNCLFFMTGFFVLFSCNAYAYIDPSATSYLVQAIAAVVIAVGAGLTIFRHKITAFFKKDKGESEKKEVVLKEELEEEESND